MERVYTGTNLHVINQCPAGTFERRRRKDKHQVMDKRLHHKIAPHHPISMDMPQQLTPPERARLSRPATKEEIGQGRREVFGHGSAGSP